MKVLLFLDDFRGNYYFVCDYYPFAPRNFNSEHQAIKWCSEHLKIGRAYKLLDDINRMDINWAKALKEAEERIVTPIDLERVC